MKILHILGDSNFGGGTAIVLDLARMAAAVGWEPSILSTDPKTLAAAADAGIETVELDCIVRPVHPWRDFDGLRRLTAYLRDQPYHLVHTHTSKAGVLGRLAAHLAGTPAIVHTVHGFAVHERSSPLAIRACAAVERFCGRRCHRIVTVSRFHRRWALSLDIAPSSKLCAIPNGIPDSRPSATLREIRDRLGLDARHFLILNHGRLAAGKGLEDLLTAFAALPPAHRARGRLILAGDGPLGPALERQAMHLGIHENVRFTGFRQDIRDLLAAADVVALPSHREGLSISLLEAMAAGCSIIASNIGSMLEATEDGACARIVPPGDPASLALALASAMEEPGRNLQLGSRARARYLLQYTSERMRSAYRELYLELAAAANIPLREPHPGAFAGKTAD